MPQKPPIPPGREPNPRHKKRGASNSGGSPKERSLRDLSRSRIPSDELPTALREISGTSDRTTCIILSAMVERDLESLLLVRLDIDTNDQNLVDLLFERDGALSTFYGNILFGMSLGLYDTEFKNQLDIIRRIRNAFAHSAMPISLLSTEVKREIDKLPNKANLEKERHTDFGDIPAEKKKFMAAVLVIKQQITEIMEYINEQEKIRLRSLEFFRNHLESISQKT